jgi:hypothetical protein
LSSKLVKLIYLGVGCHGGGFFFSPYMSLFCAFGADCQCAAISSSTAAVGTSVDRANLKCGKIFSSLATDFTRILLFDGCCFCHHHHHFIQVIYPCGVGGVVTMTL